jgi:hypothetical protein
MKLFGTHDPGPTARVRLIGTCKEPGRQTPLGSPRQSIDACIISFGTIEK